MCLPSARIAWLQSEGNANDKAAVKFFYHFVPKQLGIPWLIYSPPYNFSAQRLYDILPPRDHARNDRQN